MLNKYSNFCFSYFTANRTHFWFPATLSNTLGTSGWPAASGSRNVQSVTNSMATMSIHGSGQPVTATGPKPDIAVEGKRVDFFIGELFQNDEHKPKSNEVTYHTTHHAGHGYGNV